jgi:hypothetical protein
MEQYLINEITFHNYKKFGRADVMIRDIHIHMRKEGKRRSSTWIGN